MKENKDTTESYMVRWKYINDIMSLLIIILAIFSYSFYNKSLPRWFQFIVILSAFWLFFPDLYEKYQKAKTS